MSHLRRHLDNEFARLKAEEEKSKAANRKENETIAKLHGDCDKLVRDVAAPSLPCRRPG